MHFELVPLKGAGVLRIGMTRREVRDAMAEPPKSFSKTNDAVQPTDGFYDLCVQVFYDANGLAEYIELSRDSCIVAELGGIPIFDIPASELLKLLGREADYDSDSEEDPTDVVFPDLAMSLWRPGGNEPDDDGSKYFRTVGIGRVGYYDVGEA